MGDDTGSVLVSVKAAPETSRDSPDDLLYLSGNIEVLVEETLLVVGSFEGALLLLPSIDALADAIRKVRSGHRSVEVVLVGDTCSLWLIEKKVGRHTGLSIVYGKVETTPVDRADIDEALEQAIAAFLGTLVASRPGRSWSHEPLRILNNIISTWPSMVALTRRLLLP